MNLTIVSVQNYDKDKNGKPITDNKGVQKYRSVIKTNERGNDFLTGFVYRPLKPGEVIDATVTTEQYQGRTSLRFAINPKPQNIAQAAQHTSEVLSELKTHTMLLKGISERVEAIHMSISTHQTIEAIKKGDFDEVSPTDLNSEFASLQVSSEDDYGVA